MSEQIQNIEPLQVKAKERLQEELGSAKDNSFAEPVIGHLISRCDEDPGFAADILQEGKSWANCYEFIYKMATKEAVQDRAAIRDDVVYEWAEDYYRMTPEQEKKAHITKMPAVSAGKKASTDSSKKTSAKASKASENARKASENARKAEQNTQKPAGKKKPDSTDKTKPKNEIEGQMSLFDLL